MLCHYITSTLPFRVEKYTSHNPMNLGMEAMHSVIIWKTAQSSAISLMLNVLFGN